MIAPKCDLCDTEAVDSIDFEAGNNAEVGITVDLCQAHLEEQERTEYAFEQKYSARFEELASLKIGGGLL